LLRALALNTFAVATSFLRPAGVGLSFPLLFLVADRMSWWNRIVGGKSEGSPKPQRLDYLSEAMALERQGDYDAALTSYRLALRDRPNDTKILQNMAIAFTKTNRPEEAIRAYKSALEFAPGLSGAHYGLAFLLLKRGDRDGAAEHLTKFLAKPPSGPESERWVRHAADTLTTLQNGEAVAGESEQ
jgi:tetratricopeptide (TPR) repeat protein